MKSDIRTGNTIQESITAVDEILAGIRRLESAPEAHPQMLPELTATLGRVQETLRSVEHLDQMQQELENEKKANRARSDFLARMSHDMRTPLNGIIGLLDLCSKHPDDRQLIDASREKARVAADHLMSLVNDTLELSKLENQTAPLAREVFHLPTLLYEVEALAQMRAEDAEVDLICKTPGTELKHPYLLGSPLHVKQVLLNILTNAIKYNRQHGTVFCTLEEHDLPNGESALQFTICDTGIGMDEDFLQEIFKPYVQADAACQAPGLGAGLGMAIVKKLLERMHGTIAISSQLGVGTTVHLTLPFAVAEKAPAAKTPPLPPCCLRGLHILLVEDDALNREIAAMLLREEGALVTEAADGQAALAAFAQAPDDTFDVILMDIIMPVMDGYAATRAIRHCSKPDAATVPILAMTANAFDDDRQKSLAAGMNAHLAKPLDIQNLTETLQQFHHRGPTDGGLAG